MRWFLSILALVVGACIVTLNCGNGWTQGRDLELDTVHGMTHPGAVRDVFGPKKSTSLLPRHGSGPPPGRG